MKFAFWCWITGHVPYIIGIYQAETILSVDTEKNMFTVGEYDDRVQVCLACGKILKIIGKDYKP